MKIYQSKDLQARQRTDRPTLAFATMCKNEEHIIGKVLEAVAPYIDYLVVADNGSTDRTLDIAKEYMEKYDIPGEIHLDEWEGFDKNKNKMMEYVFDKSDYVLHLDADDILAGDFSFNNQDAGYDNYLMTMKRGTSSWKATVIYNNRCHWKFCGVAHTIIKCIEKPSYSTGDLSSRGWVIADGVGSRAFDPKKYLYDAERLTKQFWETLVEDPDGLNTRSVFYTAQSYMDYGKEDSIEKALKWNRLYLKLKDTWIEERFEAQMRISQCMMRLEQYSVEEIVKEMEKAIEIFPDRAEPYMIIGRYLNQNKKHDLAYEFLTKAKKMNLEFVKQKYILFVNDLSYGIYVNDELSVACYWTGRYDEGYNLLQELLKDDRFKDSERINNNLQHFVDRMNERDYFYDVDTLIIGGGITGLSTAAFLPNDHNYMVIESSNELGGYCKTVKRNGFVWDYSGHFFHFRDPSIKNYLLDRIDSPIKEIKKITDIDYNGNIIDFPFQYNIDQLPKSEFIECLSDMKNIGEVDNTSFKSFIKSSLGSAVSEKFLIPYNEKLYATDLNNLDATAMGRFFPKGLNQEQLEDLENFNKKDHKSYNDTFIYPREGAYEFVKSVLTRVNANKIMKNCSLISIDYENKIATTSTKKIRFKRLISTIPFNKLLDAMNLENKNLTSNKVAVFNLGFNKKTEIKTHWRYFPGDEVFYRVGFYNNIFNEDDRMSLYVEIGMDTKSTINKDKLLQQVLIDLKNCNIIEDHQLVDHEFIVMDPAYVHITKESEKKYNDWAEEFKYSGIYSIGRYGSWTYCSIEDNIIQAKNLVKDLNIKNSFSITSNIGAV